MQNLLTVLSPKETLSSKIQTALNTNTLPTATIRSDGRLLHQTRKLKFNNSALSNREHSVAVQKGNSSIITALSFEITKVNSGEKPGFTGGYFVPNIEIYSNACPLVKGGGKPLVSTQYLNSTLANVLNTACKSSSSDSQSSNSNSQPLFQKNCFSIKDAEHAYCYVCYIDVVVLCDDGSILDLVLYSMAKIFSKEIKIRQMKFDKNLIQLYQTDQFEILKINPAKLPVSLTFSIFSPTGQDNQGKSVLFIDPTFDETVLSDSNTFIIVGTIAGGLLVVEQLGSGLTEELQFEGIDLAKGHFEDLCKTIVS